MVDIFEAPVAAVQSWYVLNHIRELAHMTMVAKINRMWLNWCSILLTTDYSIYNPMYVAVYPASPPVSTVVEVKNLHSVEVRIEIEAIIFA